VFNECDGGENLSQHLRAKRHAEFLVVHFLDASIHTDLVNGSLGNELYAVVGRPDCSKLVLNFSGVQFLCSSMLGKLIAATKMMSQKGHPLRLCEICPHIRTILRRTRLDQILDIRNTEAEALES